MRTNDLFPSRFLKAEDFEDGELRTLTVKSVDLEELGQGKDKKEKPVIYFRDSDKGLVLNKTNCSIIAKLYGEETDDWFGKKITLYAIETESFGDIVRAIRVRDTSKRVAAGNGKPKPAMLPADDTPLFADAEEPIPFAEPQADFPPQSLPTGPGTLTHKATWKDVVIQTKRWPGLVEEAIKRGYVPDKSESTDIRLRQVLAGANLRSVNDLNIGAVWKVITAHYDAKQTDTREVEAQDEARAELASEGHD